MKKFLLFIAGLAAFIVLLANFGPMVLLGLSLWLLYIVFKQFIKTDSTAAKIGWVIVGLFIFGIGLTNIYAVIGVAAAYVLYLIVKNWKDEDKDIVGQAAEEDPFTNFERQWAELNK